MFFLNKVTGGNIDRVTRVTTRGGSSVYLHVRDFKEFTSRINTVTLQKFSESSIRNNKLPVRASHPESLGNSFQPHGVMGVIIQPVNCRFQQAINQESAPMAGLLVSLICSADGFKVEGHIIVEGSHHEVCELFKGNRNSRRNPC